MDLSASACVAASGFFGLDTNSPVLETLASQDGVSVEEASIAVSGIGDHPYYNVAVPNMASAYVFADRLHCVAFANTLLGMPVAVPDASYSAGDIAILYGNVCIGQNAVLTEPRVARNAPTYGLIPAALTLQDHPTAYASADGSVLIQAGFKTFVGFCQVSAPLPPDGLDAISAALSSDLAWRSLQGHVEESDPDGRRRWAWTANDSIADLAHETTLEAIEDRVVLRHIVRPFD